MVGTAATQGIRIKNMDFIKTEQLLTASNALAFSSILPQSAFVFTSANAVEALFAMVRKFDLSIVEGTSYFALEGKTAERLSELLPGAIITATAKGAKSLAKQLIKHHVKQVTFFCGNIRRDELPEMLLSENIALTEITLYKTASKPVIINEKYDGYVFFSPSGVESFFSLNSIDPKAMCFAIGETTAESLKEYTLNAIVISDQPRQEYIIKRIISHYAVR